MSSVYTLVPRPLGDMAGLDALSRYAFGLIWDRWQLSVRKENRERFRDRFGIYCYYEQGALAGELGVTLPTVRRCLRALKDQHLIASRRIGMGEPVRYYVTVRAWDHMVNLPQMDSDVPWIELPPGTGEDPVMDPDNMYSLIEVIQREAEAEKKAQSS